MTNEYNEQLVAVVKTENGFYSAIAKDNADERYKVYDLFMQEGSTSKSYSGSCGMIDIQDKVVAISNSSLVISTIWIADGFNYKLEEKATQDCIEPKIIQGKKNQPISDFDWDCMCETGYELHAMDIQIRGSESSEYLSDEKSLNSLIDFIKENFKDNQIEDFETDLGDRVTLRTLRNEEGFVSTGKLYKVLEKYDEVHNVETFITWNCDN